MLIFAEILKVYFGYDYLKTIDDINIYQNMNAVDFGTIYKNYKLNKGNDVYFDTTSFYDNFCKKFREKFCTELGQNKINAKELADKYGISIKTIYSWKYGSMPTLDKLLDLHDIIGDDIYQFLC